MKTLAVAVSLLLLSCHGFCNIWYVGASRIYTLPSQVKDLVADGDTVYIDGGVYNNDAVKWSTKNLKLIGLGTGGNRTILRYSGDIPNGKGIFVFEIPGACDNAYVENIVFDGAQVSNGNGANGAGIRYQAVNLTVNNCKFVNCQNGILEGHGSVSTSNVIIENSEFENNGYQLPNDPNYSGYEHHIYISASADTLLVQNCYFHQPRGQGNSIKTRAQRSFLLYNMIDEGSGYGSWEINIAQGGLNIIMGNVIIQGPSGANHGIVGYDAATNSLEDFYFINNTVINRYVGNIRFFNIAPATGINTFKIYNNLFASVNGASNTMFSGNIPAVLDTSHNVLMPDYLAAGFTDPLTHDYTLTTSATAAIDMGIDAGQSNTGYPLTPAFAYQSFTTSLLPRTTTGGIIDIGAYELAATLPIGLLTVAASVVGHDVQLSWPNHEQRYQYFEVERSADCRRFARIGIVAAARRYLYRDDGVLDGGTPVMCYRVKAIDERGHFTYSNVVRAGLPVSRTSLIAYPNPFTGSLQLKIRGDVTSPVVVTMKDIMGREAVKPVTYLVAEGENVIMLDDLKSLPAGAYVVSVTYGESILKQVVIKR